MGEMAEIVGEFHMNLGRTKWGSPKKWKSDTLKKIKSREIIRIMTLRFKWQQMSPVVSIFFAEIVLLTPSLYPFCWWQTISQGDVVTNLASQNKSNPDIGVPGGTEVCAGQRAGHFSSCHLGRTQTQDWGYPWLPEIHSRSLWTSWCMNSSTVYFLLSILKL